MEEEKSILCFKGSFSNFFLILLPNIILLNYRRRLLKYRRNSYLSCKQYALSKFSFCLLNPEGIQEKINQWEISRK